MSQTIDTKNMETKIIRRNITRAIATMYTKNKHDRINMLIVVKLKKCTGNRIR